MRGGELYFTRGMRWMETGCTSSMMAAMEPRSSSMEAYLIRSIW